MSDVIAALPMYDWPEVRAEVDAQWAAIRDGLRADGIAAPEWLVRRNADMPAVPGGIRDGDGRLLAPDPATLPADGLDLTALWHHPRLLLGQTCWGPMEAGLEAHVRVVAQPDYSAYEGGAGEFYSSAVVMRGEGEDVPAPADGNALLSPGLIHGRRFVCNGRDSMSGLLGIARDLAAMGEGGDLFKACEETGSHRLSCIAVAEGWADVAAIDCRTWALFRRFDPEAARRLQVVGWTARRRGLPFITAPATPPGTVRSLEAMLRLTRASCRPTDQRAARR